MKTLSKIILLSFLSFFCLAQVLTAEECKDDPDQCTPKKLCDISTEMVKGLKFWTSNLDFDEHVKFAKEIGIDCGASDPKSPCDLDANECKISELCEKATITKGSDVSWNPKAEGHVQLAKEYGLSCKVQKASSSVSKRSSRSAIWKDGKICWQSQENNESTNQSEELAKYKSEFFDRLRTILKGQEHLKIVGDRFVFSSDVLFSAGSSDLSTYGKTEISNVTEILSTLVKNIPGNIDWNIVVDAHTDNTPLTGVGEFKDNWELSQARALSVVKYMIMELNFSGSRLAANGFGEYQPISTKDTPEARAKNRRIEIKLTDMLNLDCEIYNKLANELTNLKEEKKETDKLDLRQLFISESRLKRQQIQYALSELGYYDVRVSVVGSEQVFDGKWSLGIKLALKTFASKEGLEIEKPKTIFSNLLNKVSVPSSFVKKEQKVSVPSSFVKKEQSENHSHTKKQNESGWRSLNRNPKLSFDDAKGICAAKAEERSYLSSNRQQESSSGINCRSTGSKSFSCMERRNNNYSGDMKDNILAGILNGLTDGLERSRAKKVFEKVCMADYGWIKR